METPPPCAQGWLRPARACSTGPVPCGVRDGATWSPRTPGPHGDSARTRALKRIQSSRRPRPSASETGRPRAWRLACQTLDRHVRLREERGRGREADPEPIGGGPCFRKHWETGGGCLCPITCFRDTVEERELED